MNHQALTVHRSAAALFLALVTVVGLPARASALSVLEVSSSRAVRGELNHVVLRATTDFAFQGFTVSATYDPSVITIEGIHPAGTIVEDLGSDFFEANVFPGEGSFVLGVLVDAAPPFDGLEIPGIGQPLDLAVVEFRIVESARSSSSMIRLEDGFGQPPLENRLTVNNQSQPFDQLVDGLITVETAGQGHVLFVRGDVNQDRTIDLSDPIALVGYVFLGRSKPFCLDAADANDDETLDLSDTLYLLRYQFLGGAPPPPPFDTAGLDATGDRWLDCGWSSYGRAY